MNQSKKQKKLKYGLPCNYNHSTKGEYLLAIKEVTEITPENKLILEAMEGPGLGE